MPSVQASSGLRTTCLYKILGTIITACGCDFNIQQVQILTDIICMYILSDSDNHV